MNWKSECLKILSKFFVGYGAGFSAVLGFGSQIDPTQVTIFNLAIYPTISGLIMVFPQLSKTFLEASRTQWN